MAKKNDPDGPIHKWGEPEGLADYMKKTPGEKKAKTIKVGEDTVGAPHTHYALVKEREVVAIGTKQEMLALHREEGGRVWVSTKNVGDLVEMKSFKEYKLDEAKYSVDVDGLPRFYMDADSPAQIKKMLRQLLRKASSIDSVERSNDARIKADLRQRIKGGETDKREVDEGTDFAAQRAAKASAPSSADRQKMAKVAELLRKEREKKAMKKEEVERVDESNRKMQNAMTRLVVQMKKQKKSNSAIIKALEINFPSSDPLKFLANFKNEKVKESVEYVDEKLSPSMGAGAYVKDFKDSDAPQFKGKSKEKKQKMAIAAYLAAKRGEK